MKITIKWRYVVGIDISKDVLDLCLHDRKTGHEFEHVIHNNEKGFAELGRWLDDHTTSKSQVVICSEHTGRYGEHLLSWTTRNDWAHAVLKTTTLDKMGDEHHRKTDAYDAAKLAEYGRRYSDSLRLSRAPKAVIKQLKRLQAERRKMVDRRGSLKQKLSEADYHDADMEFIVDCWRQQVALLSDHIQQLEERIHTLITEDDNLKQRSRQMRTAPGIGKVISCFWLTLFAGEPILDARKISSRFGFAPHSYSSGSSVGKPDRSAGYGNSEMRRLMHQIARSVATHKPHYRAYYEKKLAEGKPERLVINNIINKLIRLYCAMWNNRVDYDPQHITKMKKKCA